MFPTGRRYVPPSPTSVACALRCAAVLGLAVLCGPARGQQNLGFETPAVAGAAPRGWSVTGLRDGVEVTSDTRFAAEGLRSLRLKQASLGATRLLQRVAAADLRAAAGAGAATARVRLTGVARVGAGTAAPALWLRLDGADGPLFLDSFGAGREAEGAALPPSAAGTAPDDAWRRYEVELPLPADIDEVAFGVSLRGQGEAWFDDLTVVVTAADELPAAAPAAARYLDAALNLMRAHSLRRAEIDWGRLRTAAFAQARGAVMPADAHVAVRFAVRALGDRHSYLQSPGAARVLEAAAVSNARTGLPPAPPRGQRLANGIGYVAVPGFAGGTPSQQVDFAESLNNIIQQHDVVGVCGWVVDLRQNPGGNLWPMLAGLGPLLGEGELAASVYPDGRRVLVWHRDGQAGFGDYVQLRVRAPYRVRAPSPVAVLLGQGTASSAEVLAVAFAGQAAARSFGAPTRGLSAGNRTFELSDGAALVLTVAATSGRDGRVVLGPVVPDETVVDARGQGQAEDAVLDAATAWLTARDACG